MTPGQWRGCAGYGGAILALHIGGIEVAQAIARARGLTAGA